MNIRLMYVFVLTILLYACSGKQKQFDQINKLEESLYGNTQTEFNKQKALQLVDAYFEFAHAYPKDENAGNFLFKAGEVAMGMMESKKAIESFQLLYAEYPGNEKASTALFLEGFVYETQIGDLPMAQKLYQEFLEKFPDHDLSNDAQFSLNNLGKSDEEIIKEFEKKIQEEGANSTNSL